MARDALADRTSVVAFAAVGRSVGSLLGPWPRVKCVHVGGGRSDDDVDAWTLTSSTLQVLDNLSFSHPALVLLLEACESVHDVHGCGATMLTCLSVELLHGASRLLEQGFPLPAVSRCLREAVDSACTVLRALCVPLRDATSAASSGATGAYEGMDGRPFSAIASEVKQHKEEGNALLSQGHFSRAISAYSTAITLHGEKVECAHVDLRTSAAVCLANRSLTHSKIGNALLALRDAQRAVALAPSYAKGHHRLGVAMQQLGRYDEGRASLEVAGDLNARERVGGGATAARTAVTLPTLGGSPSALVALGAGLAQADDVGEMQLALSCVPVLGAMALRPSAVATHRVVGPPNARSTVRDGVALPLGAKVGALAEATLSSSFEVEAVLLDGDIVCSDTDASTELRSDGVRYAGSLDALVSDATHAHRLEATLATRIRKAGVRLVLTRGHASVDFRSCCADEGVLVVQGIPAVALEALHRATRSTPVRDGDVALALCKRQTVRLQGGILQWGALTDDVPMGGQEARRLQEPLAIIHEKRGECYLHLTCAKSAGQRGIPEEGSIAVFLCGSNDALARAAEARFWKCLHRLRTALSDGCVIPGGGEAELACAASLEKEAASQKALIPRQGDGDTADLLRCESLRLVSGALQQLVSRALQNGGSSMDEAMDSIACSIERWGRRLRVSESEGKHTATPLQVMDVLAPKLAVLHASADIAELVLGSQAACPPKRNNG